MCAVGAFSRSEMFFCTYFTYYATCISIYFEKYVFNVYYFFKKMDTYLLALFRQWLNIFIYPWISAPSGEISPWRYSSLLVLLPLCDLD